MKTLNNEYLIKVIAEFIVDPNMPPLIMNVQGITEKLLGVTFYDNGFCNVKIKKEMAINIDPYFVLVSILK